MRIGKNHYKKEFIMNIKTHLIFGLSMAFAFPLFAADKIIIKDPGEPIVIQKSANGNVYTVPQNFRAGNGSYYYVNLDGTKTVCYTNPPAELKTVASNVIQVTVGGSQVPWTCFDSSNFDIQ
jgi:hypothetical protein